MFSPNDKRRISRVVKKSETQRSRPPRRAARLLSLEVYPFILTEALTEGSSASANRLDYADGTPIVAEAITVYDHHWGTLTGDTDDLGVFVWWGGKRIILMLQC